MTDVIFKVICSVLLLINFLCFLILAIELTTYPALKAHSRGSYSMGRITCLIFSMASLAFCFVIWASDFDQKVTMAFKVGLVIILAAFGLTAAFILVHRKQLFSLIK